MKTLVMYHMVGDGEHRCRIFDGDLSRFDGAQIEMNELGHEISPLIFGEDDFVHDDWTEDNEELTALINAKEWDVMIFVEDYS